MAGCEKSRIEFYSLTVRRRTKINQRLRMPRLILLPTHRLPVSSKVTEIDYTPGPGGAPTYVAAGRIDL